VPAPRGLRPICGSLRFVSAPSRETNMTTSRSTSGSRFPRLVCAKPVRKPASCTTQPAHLIIRDRRRDRKGLAPQGHLQKRRYISIDQRNLVAITSNTEIPGRPRSKKRCSHDCSSRGRDCPQVRLRTLGALFHRS